MAISLSLSHCAALVRAHDHDRYLCALFAPPEAREAWFALFAFNHEIAAIPESVSEEMLGFVRFAWWREALEEIYAGSPVRRHPVAQALAEVVAAHKLPRALLEAMLDARQERFAGETFTELPQWESYFSAASSSLFRLCALAAGVPITDSLEALGIAWGALGTARMAAIEGDKASAEPLTQAVEVRLNSLRGLPEPFMAFKHTLEFYLKRMRKGKSTDNKIKSLLILNLCLRQWLRRLK